MRRARGWTALWLVCATALAFGCAGSAGNDSARSQGDSVRSAAAPATGTALATPPPPSSAREDASAFGSEVGFRSATRLDEHFAKHGAEFGTITKGEYLRQAQALRDAPASATVLEVRRPDGVVSRFDRRSGAFIAFDPDGIIRTFFRPNDGEAYFRRQARRRPNP